MKTSVKYETDKPWFTAQFKNILKARQHAHSDPYVVFDWELELYGKPSGS